MTHATRVQQAGEHAVELICDCGYRTLIPSNVIIGGHDSPARRAKLQGIANFPHGMKPGAAAVDDIPRFLLRA